MQDNKNFLAAEPIGKLLLKLSIPTVIAQLINMLYNIVDRIYIGHIPSDGSLESRIMNRQKIYLETVFFSRLLFLLF